jgi:hypothetical protein
MTSNWRPSGRSTVSSKSKGPLTITAVSMVRNRDVSETSKETGSPVREITLPGSKLIPQPIVPPQTKKPASVPQLVPTHPCGSEKGPSIFSACSILVLITQYDAPSEVADMEMEIGTGVGRSPIICTSPMSGIVNVAAFALDCAAKANTASKMGIEIKRIAKLPVRDDASATTGNEADGQYARGLVASDAEVRTAGSRCLT